MHAALDPFLPEPLPPPPRRPRLARGSIVPELAIDVRAVEPSGTWSRVVPVSPVTGLPILARDRRPAEPGPTRLERAGAALVGVLTVATAVLAILLVR